MKQLADLYQDILRNGERKPNRTGIDTISVFGRQMRFDLSKGFPLDTQKFVPFKLVASELLWFLKGEQDLHGSIKDLHANNNHIWDEWEKPGGHFGPIYGVQWRRWLPGGTMYHHNEGEYSLREMEREGMGGETCDVSTKTFDQIAWLINEMRTNPESRRLIVTAWQPVEVPYMALPPCHVLFQLNCRRRGDGWVVDLQLYQRSCDAFLGVPFNVASYALLLHLLCHCAGPEYTPGDFVWTGGDVHLYDNHYDAVQQYLSQSDYPLPTFGLTFGAPRDIDAITLGHLQVVNYLHGGKISAEVAV